MLESLKKIYRLFPDEGRLKLVLLFGMMLIASLLEVLGIGMIPAFVMAVSDPDKILQYPVVGDWLRSINITTSDQLIIWGAVVMIIVYIIKNLYLSFFLYYKKKFVADKGVELQDRLFRAYLTAPYPFYINRNSADLLRNVTGEVNKIIDGTMLPILELALNITMFVFIIGSLFYLEPLITLLTIVLMGGLGAIFLGLTRKKTDEYGRQDRYSRGEMNKAVIQGLGGFKDARILNRENLFLNDYRENAEMCKRAGIYRYVIGKLPKPIIETLAVMGILLIALVMVWDGRAVSSIVPILALFGAATVRLMPIFNQVIAQVTKLQYNAYSVGAIFRDLKYLKDKYDDYQKKVLSHSDKFELDRQIELSGVTYRYPNADEQAVRDVSLRINKGSAVAFVGPTGAGKTTMVDIILGLLEPQEGTIYVDGKDIYSNIRGWMKNIGYIPQSIYLLDDTIRRNIAFGIPDDQIDEEKLHDAIEAAQLQEMISRLSEGTETVVGERGIRLSGGQKQRIGIARALYNNPQVLIMDEATSSLDNLTEKFVIQAIERLRGDRTIIMIAHRLTTVQNCDNIFMLKEGRMVNQGTYDELLESSVEFRKMSLTE